MLKDFAPRKHVIEVDGCTFEVKGLTLESVANLLMVNADIVNDLFAGKLQVTSLITSAPGFVAAAIANAAGEPDGVKAAAGLPAGIQLEALEAIWDMTIPNEAALGKLVSRLQGGNLLQK